MHLLLCTTTLTRTILRLDNLQWNCLCQLQESIHLKLTEFHDITKIGSDRLLLTFYPIKKRKLLDYYRRKLTSYPLLEAVRNVTKGIQGSSTRDALDQILSTMNEVVLPDTFWKRFKLSTKQQSTSDQVAENHDLLENLT